jgi:hypothetical protein
LNTAYRNARSIVGADDGGNGALPAAVATCGSARSSSLTLSLTDAVEVVVEVVVELVVDAARVELDPEPECPDDPQPTPINAPPRSSVARARGPRRGRSRKGTDESRS